MKKAAPERPKAQPKPADHSLLMIPSTTSSIPTAGCRPCARSRTSWRTIDEKKSLIYFSSGMDRTGIENQSQLRSATNAAVRANMAIYTMDIRGLQALVAGRRSPERQPARDFALLRQVGVQRVRLQRHHPGNAGHAGRRHRRTRISRLQRFWQGVYRSAAGHLALLPARLSQHECGARRAFPPHHGAGQPARTQTRFPARLLRSCRLPAFHPRRSRTPARRRTGVGSFHHRFAGVLVRGLLPHCGPQILCAGVAWSCRARRFLSPTTTIRTAPRSMFWAS